MRIYHPYQLWEDYKAGFYDNISGKEKDFKIYSAIDMFNSKLLTREYMFRVVNEWKYSCEHNLTNESMNKIAYIGQAACCLYDAIPNTLTMIAWGRLDEDTKERANKIAQEALTHWENNNKKLLEDA